VQKLNFPNFKFNIKKSNNNFYILDIYRKKFVKITPEEWVRQHAARYLIEYKNFLASSIEIEKQIRVNNQLLRLDILFNDKSVKPLLLVECKAATVKITQAVADQIFTYNSQVNAPYLLLTNGLTHYFFEINDKGFPEKLEQIPNFKTLKKE